MNQQQVKLRATWVRFCGVRLQKQHSGWWGMALGGACISSRLPSLQPLWLGQRLHTVRHPVSRRRRETWRPAANTDQGTGPSGALAQVLQKIDQLNLQDPRTIFVDSEEHPYEYIYSCWLSDWVKRLEPNPSEELQIVARGQHVQRWKSSRDSYPEGRAGYLKWREDLKHMHAKIIVQLMAEANYSQEIQEAVKRMILKKDLKSDVQTQILEDALCLVFLERQFAETREKLTDDKMLDILRKTWSKMGERGKEAALKLNLPKEEARLVQTALFK